MNADDRALASSARTTRWGAGAKLAAALLALAMAVLGAGGTGCDDCVESGELCPAEGAEGCCSEACQEYNGYLICS